MADALGTGEQILILRKGGIHEDHGGFAIEHPEFLIFPTLFHQQRESVLPRAQARFDEISAQFPVTDRLRIELFAKVIEGRRLDTLAAAEQLRGQHIWRDEVIAGRFDWSRQKNIHALAVRIFRLPHVVELPMLAAYAGCKSWIELESDISVEGAQPVLDDATFAQKLEHFRNALQLEAAGARN
ncbi:MAG: DUF1802 family protein [Verrucomicrobia bacterium]|nr:DUF1802 family protein [Verrucomicrobiota bacterium]